MNKFTKCNILSVVSVFFMLFMFYCCNTQKKIIKEPIKDKGADFIFEKLKKNEFQFEQLNIKLSANITINKKNNSFNGNLRIKKDSVVWISISPALGIEAARILITADSVKFLNRIETSCFSGDFNYINNLFKINFDFDMLQSLIVGNDFSLYENNVFKASVDGKQYLLSTLGRRKLKKFFNNNDDSSRIVMQDIWLNPDNYKISKIHLKELKSNRKLFAEYSDYTTVDSLLFPKKIKYLIITDKEKIEISIENDRISTSNSIEFPFNISNKYKKNH